jgi:hypothetical protein
MLKEQAGHSVEILPQADRQYLEHRYCESVRQICETLDTSSLDRFTFSLIDSLWDVLNHILHELEQLPEAVFKELIEVIESLSEARNELRLARFLFELEEINALHRLILRNRAVLRGRDILHKMLLAWPVQALSKTS